MDNKIRIIGKGIINDVRECLRFQEQVDPKLWRKMDPLSRMAVAAARTALEDAGLNISDLPREDTGVIIGTVHGPASSKKRFVEEIYKYGANLASAFIFPNTVMNMASGMISIDLGVKGVNCTLATDENPFDAAVSYASELISKGKADIIIAGEINEVNDIVTMIEGDKIKNGANIIVLESERYKKRK